MLTHGTLIGLILCLAVPSSSLQHPVRRGLVVARAGKGFGGSSTKKPAAVKTPKPSLEQNEPKNVLTETTRTKQEKASELTQEDIFAKYGYQEEKAPSAVTNAEAEDGFDLLRLIPPSVQLGIERVLLGAIVILLLAFVAIGIAITYEAFAVSSNQPLPEDTRHLIVDIMEPAFTPILLVGLACSVSLGGLKALQLSSGAVQYKES